MRAVWRILFLIPIAFVLACIAAGLFFVFGLIGFGPDGVFLGLYFWDTTLLILGVASATGALVAIPFILAIILAEAFGWRSVLVYLLIGGGVGLWVALTLTSTQAMSPEVRSALFPAAGCVGGFVYWLIAGRTAGIAEQARNA